MRMSPKSYKNMNDLATKCFDANAVVDNLAYSLDFHFYNEIAKVVHLKVAHVMPEWADNVTDKMLELGGRPTRQPIGNYIEDYQNVKDVFNVLHQLFMNMRDGVMNLIDDADMDNDAEVRIFGEDFLEKLSVFIKQAEEWINAANVMDVITLNNHIEDYTHFIAL